MGYIRAEEILPIEIIELIQQYVDGKNIYIPRKSSHRQAWGTGTQIKQEPCSATDRFMRIILQEAAQENWPANIFCLRKAYSAF